MKTVWTDINDTVRRKQAKYKRILAKDLLRQAVGEENFQIDTTAPVDFVAGGAWVTVRVFIPNARA